MGKEQGHRYHYWRPPAYAQVGSLVLQKCEGYKFTSFRCGVIYKSACEHTYLNSNPFFSEIPGD